MGTVIRAEVSAKNKYWLSKHRYYELKHFCLQYPEWKRAYHDLDGLPARSASVSDSEHDMREAEIWYQMMWYLNENIYGRRK